MSNTPPTDDTTWATGGTADVVEPLLAQKQDGWDVSDRPPAQWFNFWQRSVHRWVDFFREKLVAPTTSPADSAILAIRGTGVAGIGAVELSSNAADADDTLVGAVGFGDKNSISAEKRIVHLEARTNGTTANNRGGKLDLFIKGDAFTSIGRALRLTHDLIDTMTWELGQNLSNVHIQATGAASVVGKFLKLTSGSSIAAGPNTPAGKMVVQTGSSIGDRGGVIEFNGAKKSIAGATPNPVVAYGGFDEDGSFIAGQVPGISGKPTIYCAGTFGVSSTSFDVATPSDVDLAQSGSFANIIFNITVGIANTDLTIRTFGVFRPSDAINEIESMVLRVEVFNNSGSSKDVAVQHLSGGSFRNIITPTAANMLFAVGNGQRLFLEFTKPSVGVPWRLVNAF
jgi:hypothetical protein